MISVKFSTCESDSVVIDDSEIVKSKTVEDATGGIDEPDDGFVIIETPASYGAAKFHHDGASSPAAGKKPEYAVSAAGRQKHLLDVFSDHDILTFADLAYNSYYENEYVSYNSYCKNEYIKRSGSGYLKVEFNADRSTSTGLKFIDIPQIKSKSDFTYLIFFNTDSKKYVVSFGGTTNMQGATASVKHFIGMNSMPYDNAMKLVSELTTKAGTDNVICVGHSLGGGLSIAAAKLTGCYSVTFNPPDVNNSVIDNYVRKHGLVARARDQNNRALTFAVTADPLTVFNRKTTKKEYGTTLTIPAEKSGISLECHKIQYIRDVLPDYLKNLRALRAADKTPQMKFQSKNNPHCRMSY